MREAQPTHQQQNLSQDKYAEYYIPNHAVTSHDNHFGKEKRSPHCSFLLYMCLFMLFGFSLIYSV